MIWLDTSVLINMTRYRLGKASNSAKLKRESELFDIILQKVKERKLLCPQGDQQEELTRPVREFQSIQSMLSRGIHFRHRSEIKEAQMHIAMEAYIKKSREITINCQEALAPDLLQNLHTPQRFVIDAYSNKSIRLLERERKKKQQHLNALVQLKKIRQEANVSFEEQYETELTGDYQAVCSILNSWKDILAKQQLPTEDLVNQTHYLDELVYLWDSLEGSPEGIGGLLQFLQSNEWRVTPYNDVSAYLYAKLISKDGTVKSGDPMDICQLIVALVYCNYVICDKSMRNLIKELGLDKKNKVKVFSIADVEEIISELTAL